MWNDNSTDNHPWYLDLSQATIVDCIFNGIALLIGWHLRGWHQNFPKRKSRIITWEPNASPFESLRILYYMLISIAHALNIQLSTSHRHGWGRLVERALTVLRVTNQGIQRRTELRSERETRSAACLVAGPAPRGYCGWPSNKSKWNHWPRIITKLGVQYCRERRGKWGCRSVVL